jgi:multicomponent Na+:H+ antiporter subunit A
MGVSVALTLALTPFFGPARRYERRPHEASFAMVAMPAVLAVTGMVLGIDPDLVFVKLIGPAAAQVVGSPDPVVIPLEKGWGLPLVLSFVTIAVGIALYLVRRPFSRLMAFAARWLPLSGERGFDAVMAGLKAFAAWLTAILQNGSLTRYLAVTLLVAVALPASALLRTALPPFALPDPLTLRWDIVAVVLLMAVASLVVVFAVSRLLAVCALGIVGYGTGFLFLVYGAVDVALTQLLVETLFVVIITAVLLRLPALGPEIRHGAGTALRNGVIAVAAGVVVTALILVVAAYPVDRTVSSFFEQNSLPAAHGRNIVNVILVDFRALDTLGEIIVVATAALGIWAMLGLRPRKPGRTLAAGGATP